jgi:hypothetical protein
VELSVHARTISLKRKERGVSHSLHVTNRTELTYSGILIMLYVAAYFTYYFFS